MPLERRLNLFSVIAISIMSMVGSGLFALPGIIVHHTGPSSWLAYLFAGLCVLPAAMSKAELATAMPSTGGTYIYMERSLGPLSGTIMGLGLWLSIVLKSSFALVGLGAYMSILTSFDIKNTALIILAIIFIANLLGISFLSKMFTFIVAVTLFSLFFLLMGSQLQLPSVVYKDYFAQGISGFVMATALVFISYAGVTKIVTLAEEIKEPEKNLPRGILISLLLVTGLYCFTSYVLVDKIPLKSLDQNLRPVYDLSMSFGYEIVGIFTAVIACLTMASMANAGVLVSSRFPFAMSRDKLLPTFLGRLTKKFLTPLWSIMMSCFLIALFIVFLNPSQIVKFASSFIIFIYVMENFIVILFREMRVQWYNPSYKTPFYPFLQIFGLTSGIVFLIAIGLKYLVFSIGTISVLGTLVYIFYSYKKVKRRGLLALREGKISVNREESEKELQNLYEEKELYPQKTSSMVALFGEETSPENLVELALALGDEKSGTAVSYMVEVPEQTNINDVTWQTHAMRSIRRRMNAMSEYKNQPIHFDIVFSHDVYQRITNISEQIQCRWLITQWVSPSVGKTLTPYDPIKRLRDELSCHMITFKDDGIRFYKRILVILSQTKSDLLNIYTADHLAQLYSGTIDLVLYQLEKQNKDDLTEYGLMLSAKCQSKVSLILLSGDDQDEQIIDLTSSYDLLILTDFSKNSILERIFGSKNNRLIEKATCSVVAIQKKSL